MEQKQFFYAPGLMDLSNYRLKKISDEKEWDELVKSSEQGTLFNETPFINALDDLSPALWGCFKGSELKGGICLFEKNTREGFRPDQVIYNSIMLAKPDSAQSTANQFAEQFRTISAITKELTSIYTSIHFQTHSSLVDIRPLLWHNYDTELEKFSFIPRYTSIVLLKESIGFSDDFTKSPLYLQCAKSRRQEIRYAIAKGAHFKKLLDLDLFANLYRATFIRQNKQVCEEDLKKMLRICEFLHEAGRLNMYIVFNRQNEPGSIAIFGWDNKRAYYLYGANSEIARDTHTGSYILYMAFQDLLNQGITEVDLEGVNSPARGHFKMSFGGRLDAYYAIKI